MDDIKKQLEDDDEILWKGMPEKSPYLTALHAWIRQLPALKISDNFAIYSSNNLQLLYFGSNYKTEKIFRYQTNPDKQQMDPLIILKSY